MSRYHVCEAFLENIDAHPLEHPLKRSRYVSGLVDWRKRRGRDTFSNVLHGYRDWHTCPKLEILLSTWMWHSGSSRKIEISFLGRARVLTSRLRVWAEHLKEDKFQTI